LTPTPSIHRSGVEHEFSRPREEITHEHEPPCSFLPPSVPILESAVDLRMLLDMLSIYSCACIGKTHPKNPMRTQMSVYISKRIQYGYKEYYFQILPQDIINVEDDCKSASDSPTLVESTSYYLVPNSVSQVWALSQLIHLPPSHRYSMMSSMKRADRLYRNDKSLTRVRIVCWDDAIEVLDALKTNSIVQELSLENRAQLPQEALEKLSEVMQCNTSVKSLIIRLGRGLLGDYSRSMALWLALRAMAASKSKTLTRG
jgi:hypothetical protein